MHSGLKPAALFVLLLSIAAAKALSPPGPAAAHSVSGQFVVRSLRRVERPLPPAAKTNLNLIRLDSTLVAISCERIKQVVYRELGFAPEWRDKVIHAVLAIGDQVVMASDAPPQMYEKPQGFSVSLSVPTPADAERVFGALSEKGSVKMPLQQTF